MGEGRPRKAVRGGAEGGTTTRSRAGRAPYFGVGRENPQNTWRQDAISGGLTISASTRAAHFCRDHGYRTALVIAHAAHRRSAAVRTNTTGTRFGGDIANGSGVHGRGA